MYGPSVKTYYTHDAGKSKGDKAKGPLDGDGRRSVYLEVRRNVTNPVPRCLRRAEALYHPRTA